MAIHYHQIIMRACAPRRFLLTVINIFSSGKERRLKNCIIKGCCHSEQSEESIQKKISNLLLYVFGVFLLVFCFKIYSQEVTLDYIFQDTNIVNPRPSLKFINSKSNKIFYYADDDYN